MKTKKTARGNALLLAFSRHFFSSDTPALRLNQNRTESGSGGPSGHLHWGIRRDLISVEA